MMVCLGRDTLSCMCRKYFLLTKVYMILREVTVGRSKDCDIFLDPRCVYASSYHGTIYYDGNTLMFRDTSSNGTMINNVSVRNRAVPIHHGDIIMLAGQYQLNWNQIDAFFPKINQNHAAHSTMLYDKGLIDNARQATPDFKWNWGAFGLYPIWGFFNGCSWGILISILLGWLYPIPNIVFGICGSSWSWHNKKWKSVDEFKDVQSNWSIAGVIFAIIGMLAYVVNIAIFLESL